MKIFNWIKFITFNLLLATTGQSIAKPTAILFDCDGVLVDTEYMKYEAWQKALLTYDINLSETEYMQLAGGSSINIAKGIARNNKCDFDADKVIKHKNVLYQQANARGVPVIAHAAEFLNTLLEKKTKLNIVVAIVSSDARSNTINNLKCANIKTELLDGIFSGHDDLGHITDIEGKNKPKPYIYQFTAEKLSIDPKTTIVIEDTAAGVQAAIGAGMHAIAVPNKFTKNQDFSGSILITNLANFKISDLMQIL